MNLSNYKNTVEKKQISPQDLVASLELSVLSDELHQQMELLKLYTEVQVFEFQFFNEQLKDFQPERFKAFNAIC